MFRFTRVSAYSIEPIHCISRFPLAAPYKSSRSRGTLRVLSIAIAGAIGNPVNCNRTDPRCTRVRGADPDPRERLGGSGAVDPCQLVTSASPCNSPPKKLALIDDRRTRSGVRENEAPRLPFCVLRRPFVHSISFANNVPSAENFSAAQNPLPSKRAVPFLN